MISNQIAIDTDAVSFADAIGPVATLLGGVPTLTLLVMTAVRYVANGTI